MQRLRKFLTLKQSEFLYIFCCIPLVLCSEIKDALSDQSYINFDQIKLSIKKNILLHYPWPQKKTKKTFSKPEPHQLFSSMSHRLIHPNPKRHPLVSQIVHYKPYVILRIHTQFSKKLNAQQGRGNLCMCFSFLHI